VADIEDVADALASIVTGFLTGAGGAPLTGVQTDVFAGWPEPTALKQSLAAGNVTVSVYAMPGATSAVTRHQRDWERTGTSAITTTAAVAGGTITFGGTITLPLNVTIQAPGNKSASYAAQTGDTLATLASGVATALNLAGVQASANGAAVTVADGGPLTVSLGGQGTLIRENAREKQVFQITVWAPTQALRLATSRAFEALLMGLDVVALPDGSQGNIMFMRNMLNDHSQLENLYRRDVWMTVEYPITETTIAWDVVSVEPSLTQS
jgi:hypothetical protein